MFAAVSAIALGGSGPASASVAIGQLPASAPAPACPSSGHDYLQTSVTGGNLYSARAAGTITSWSTNSSGAGATYVFKVFRRTSDPDFFQVVGRATERTLSTGLNTFSSSLQVKSGDLIGLHAQGGAGGNSCAFPTPGDGAFQSQAASDLATGQSAQFVPFPDVRLNLSAVLVPSNAFTITGITRHRRGGTATLAADLSNPGLATIGGKGIKKRHVTTAVASRITFKIATIGKSLRRLSKKGRLRIPVTMTFIPTGGDASTQTIVVKLIKLRPPPPV